jgi:hypothetical protein
MDKFASDEKIQQQQFNVTIREFSKNETANKARFDKLIDHEEELAAAQTGILTPADEPTPPISCGRLVIPDGAMMAVLDQAGVHGYAIFQKLPHVIVESRSHGPVISVDRATGGGISIILDLRSNDGKIIARINKDGYVINRNNTLEIRKDEHSLEVVDLYGQNALSLRYVNPKTLLIRGPNIGLLPNVQDWCSINTGAADFSLP